LILFFWFPVTAGVLFWVGLYIIGDEL